MSLGGVIECDRQEQVYIFDKAMRTRGYNSRATERIREIGIRE